MFISPLESDKKSRGVGPCFSNAGRGGYPIKNKRWGRG